MKKTIRRWISCILVFVMLFSALPTLVLAAEIVASGYCGGDGDETNLEWTLDDKGTLTITGSGSMPKFSYITRIPWYSHRDSIKKVIIGDNVTSIGGWAFYTCTNLNSITIGNSVRSIGDFAFKLCEGLTSIEFPDSMTTIGRFAFSGCSGLTSIEIPASMKYICDQAFGDCTGLISVYFCGKAPSITVTGDYYSSFRAGVTFYYIPGMEGWTDSEGYNESTGKWYGYKLAIWEERVPIASGYCGGDGDGTNLEWTLDKAGTLTITGTGRMKNYSMHDDDMPWFQYMDEINTIIVGEGITEIGEDAFAYANVKQAYLPATLKRLNGHSFYACDYLSEINLPQSLTYIGRGVFYGCDSLEEITIPKAVSFIGDSALVTCSNLKNIYVASDNEHYADIDGVLFNKSQTYLHSFPTGRSGQYSIPQGVETVGSYAFRYATGLDEVEFPDSLTKIDDGAFSFCSSLKSVDIGTNISYIGSGAWVGCTKLSNIEVAEGNGRYCDIEGVLFTKDKSTLMMYPAGRRDTYSVPEGTKTIGASAFGSGLLSGIHFSEDVKNIYANAFRSCYGLTEIVIPLNISNISLAAFEYCSNLELVTFEGMDVSFGQDVFGHCSKDLALVAHSGSSVVDYASSNDLNYVWNKHVWDTKFTVDVSPTCTAKGSQSIHCLDCAVRKDTKDVPKTGHSPAEAAVENEKVATCKQEGSYDAVIYCDVCEIELSRETKTTEKADCQPGGWIIDREATPWREGSKHKECINCGTVLETETIPATHWGGSSGNRDPFPKDDDEEFDGNENPFHDIGKNNWFYKDVLFVYLNGLMNGVSNGKFDPNGETTRAMVITILWRLAGKPIVNSDVVFVDVPNNQWYTDAIRWAASEGIVGGVGGSKFAPDGFITREQLATMLYRYEAYANGETEANNETTFADYANVSSWARDAVNWCSNNGIVNGKGENQFAPKDSSTRAELAAMLHRYIER